MQKALATYNDVALPANSNPQGNAVPILDAEGGLNVNAAYVVGLAQSQSLQVTGIAAVSTTGTMAATTVTERADASGGAITRTLQPAAVCPGQIVVVKKIDSSGNVATVKGNASETIDGANTFTGLSAQWKSVILQSNGVSWDILAVK